MGLFWGTKIRALDVTKDDGNYIGVERQKSIVMRFRLGPNKNIVAALVFVVYFSFKMPARYPLSITQQMVSKLAS